MLRYGMTFEDIELLGNNYFARFTMQINRHGSFYIRNGWPTKIIDAIFEIPLLFSPNNELAAVDTLGVGRVMVKAMRYWSVVLGITNEVKTPQGVAHQLTQLGDYIRDHDPYCQDIGTLWLLHRNLSSRENEATAWWWLYNCLDQQTFTKDSFSNAFYLFLQKEGETYTRKSVEKEFDCLKNTYASEKAFDVKKIMEEDTVAELVYPKDLLQKSTFSSKKLSSRRNLLALWFAVTENSPWTIFLLPIIITNLSKVSFLHYVATSENWVSVLTSEIA